MKTCYMCKAVKSLDQFNKSSSSPDKRQPHCKECANAAARKNYQENKERYKAQAKKREEEIFRLFAELKDKPCADCNIKYPPYVMDFDHRGEDPKEFNLSAARRRRMAISKILAEAAKCDLVCANCHRIRTNKRRPSMYTKLEMYGAF